MTSIKAMCIGMVKPYFAAGTASRRTRILPTSPSCTPVRKANLDHQPNDRNVTFMGIQWNYNYNAKMHADKNHHDPSFIIGLGDFGAGTCGFCDGVGTMT